MPIFKELADEISETLDAFIEDLAQEKYRQMMIASGLNDLQKNIPNHLERIKADYHFMENVFTKSFSEINLILAPLILDKINRKVCEYFINSYSQAYKELSERSSSSSSSCYYSVDELSLILSFKK